MNTTTKPTWSKRDEAVLQEMIRRKQAFELTARMPVHDVITRIRAALGAVFYGPDQMVDEFINNADAIRDALEPFDSGVRVAQSDSTPG